MAVMEAHVESEREDTDFVENTLVAVGKQIHSLTHQVTRGDVHGTCMILYADLMRIVVEVVSRMDCQL